MGHRSYLFRYSFSPKCSQKSADVGYGIELFKYITEINSFRGKVTDVSDNLYSLTLKCSHECADLGYGIELFEYIIINSNSDRGKLTDVLEPLFTDVQMQT